MEHDKKDTWGVIRCYPYGRQDSPFHSWFINTKRIDERTGTFVNDVLVTFGSYSVPVAEAREYARKILELCDLAEYTAEKKETHE